MALLDASRGFLVVVSMGRDYNVRSVGLKSSLLERKLVLKTGVYEFIGSFGWTIST